MKVDEVLRWLERAGEDLTLVGGQAVALWEHLLGLPVLTETVDIEAELARSLETSWPSAQRLENPRHSPTLRQLEKAAAALGKRLVLALE